MYTEYYQLTRRPFSRVPTAESSVMFPTLKASFVRACECIDDFAGPVLVVGGSGCGKSTFLAILDQHYQTHQLAIVNLNCAAITCRQELIQCLLFELGQPFTSTNVGELRLKLIDHLKSDVHCPNGMLLLIDEAHSMSVDVLEELRMITNLICGSQQQIRLVVAGTQALEETLLSPKMESFNQRISTRCYMQPMTRTETMYYALTQMQACGRDGREIFRPSALDQVYDITNGVLRLSAQLCDHVLKLSAKGQIDTIDAAIVQRAWADLQQLPVEEEVIGNADDQPASGIIEFGSLDDGSDSQFESFDSPAISNADPVDLVAEIEANDSTLGFTENETSEPSENQDEMVEDVVNIDSYREETAEPAAPSLMRFPENDDDNQHDDAGAVEATAPRVDSTLDHLIAQIDEIDRPEEPSLSIAHASHQEDAATEHNDPSTEKDADDQPAGIGNHSEIADLSSVVEEGLGEADSNVAGLAKLDPEKLKTLTQAIASAHALSEMQYEKEQSHIADRVDLSDAARRDNTSRVEPSAEDLFGESFDDEEHVDEIQNAALADQNRISSGLTSEELSSLSPIGTISDQVPVEPEFEEQVVSSDSFITPTCEGGPAIDSTVDSIETETETGTVSSTDSPDEQEAYESYDQVSLSDESRTEAASLTDASKHLGNSEEQRFTEQSFVTPTFETEPKTSEPTDSVAEAERIKTAADGLPPDDSDMLVSAPLQQELAATENESPPVANAEPSSTDESQKGQVIRMNYQELFQQLRQTPGSET